MKRSSKVFQRDFTCDVFPIRVRLYVGKDMGSIVAKRSSDFDISMPSNPGAMGNMTTLTRDNCDPWYIISIVGYNTYTINHEVLHLVTSVMDDLGMPVSSDNDELMAYYQTYWCKRIDGTREAYKKFMDRKAK